MEYLEALKSNSSPKIEKAARQISKKKLEGYGPHLLGALKSQIEIRRAWKSQSELIKAIGVTDYVEALPLLKELIQKDYKATVLYRHLAFTILLLENTTKLKLEFLYSSISKGNSLQIGGACSALLYSEIVPANHDIQKITSGVAPFTENEGRVTSPRTYIAAVAYLWPKEEVKEFLEMCLTSKSSILVEIAESSLQGKKPYYTLV